MGRFIAPDPIGLAKTFLISVIKILKITYCMVY
nr:hypothetical protein [Photorhabdus khanii]